MTRGRHRNTAHLVATTLDEARRQWIDTFTRDRADLGPTHAADRAAEDIDRYPPAHHRGPCPGRSADGPARPQNPKDGTSPRRSASSGDQRVGR